MMDDLLSPPPTNSSALQELETLEKFLKEARFDAIVDATNDILKKIKLNIEKVKNTNEEYFILKFVDFLKRLDAILKSDFSPSIIFMADGKCYSGGLCDLFRNICWLYLLSKLLNCDFKICFTYPFNLSEYLTENEHKWYINREDIINGEAKKIVVASFDFTGGPQKFENTETDTVSSKCFVQTISDLVNKYERILCYFHIKGAKYLHFRETFFELFSPSQKLQNNIDANLKKTSEKFVAAHFRFQKLLGDFKDTVGKTLDDAQKEILIERCINILQEIAEHSGGLKILVCSDSVCFLKAAKNLDFVFTVDGGKDIIKHTAVANDIDDEDLLKLFTDLFLMSYAERIYTVVEGDMYGGCFAKTAALLGQTQYYVVTNGDFERKDY